MEQPTAEESRVERYFQRRWTPQYKYYSKSSAHNKKWHQRIQLFIVIAGVLIPVLINLDIPDIFTGNLSDTIPMPTWVPTLLGLLIAVATSVENVKKYGDNWRNYRQTLEALKRELALYEALGGDYAEIQEPFALFVQRSEQIMGEETTRFNKYISEEIQTPTVTTASRRIR